MKSSLHWNMFMTKYARSRSILIYIPVLEIFTSFCPVPIWHTIRIAMFQRRAFYYVWIWSIFHLEYWGYFIMKHALHPNMSTPNIFHFKITPSRAILLCIPIMEKIKLLLSEANFIMKHAAHWNMLMWRIFPAGKCFWLEYSNLFYYDFEQRTVSY